MAQYHCKHCKEIVDRKSQKRWIKSRCTQCGEKLVHLMRVVPYKPKPRKAE